MEAHNIKLLKIPPKYTRPIKLDDIEDPKLPKQTAEELAKRNDVLENVYFSSAQTKAKNEYRMKLKSNKEFDNLYCYIIVVFVHLFFDNRRLSSMTEVVIAEHDCIGIMKSNDEESVRSLWKFCKSITITLLRSEVVFFTQATLIFILVIASLFKPTDRHAKKCQCGFHYYLEQLVIFYLILN